MSDTPDEFRDHQPIVRNARGSVLINGLGLGMVLGALLAKPEVVGVTVIEIDPDVIALVGPHYGCDRVRILNADAFAFKPPASEHYGAVWHDIWDHIDARNLPPMASLRAKYATKADWQGCWAEACCQELAAKALTLTVTESVGAI